MEGWWGEEEEEMACNRLQDFHALVERAEYEGIKEQKEGHIRSNSLVFNTFIFLQVRISHFHCVSLGTNRGQQTEHNK